MKTSVNSVQCIESSRLTGRLPIFSLSERGSGSPSEAAPVAGRNQSESVANCPDSVPTESTAKLREGSALNPLSDKRITRLLSLTTTELDAIRGKLLARSTRTASGCLVWQGAVTQSGYGCMLARSKGWVESTHVLALYVFGGIAVPSRFATNHRCENKLCLEHTHLQQATHRENALYSDTLQSRNLAKTHCPSGHEYSGDNLRLTKRNRRVCVTCHRRWCRESNARARSATLEVSR